MTVAIIGYKENPKIKATIDKAIDIQKAKMDETVKTLCETLAKVADAGGGEEYLLAVIEKFTKEEAVMESLMSFRSIENGEDDHLREILRHAEPN